MPAGRPGGDPHDIAYRPSVPYKDSFLIVGGYTEKISYFNPGTYFWDVLNATLIQRPITAFMVDPGIFPACADE